MGISAFSRRHVLLALALAFSVALIPTASGADHGPAYAAAEPVDGATIRIFWGDDPLAESYRIERTNGGTIAVLPKHVNEYLDTGLTAGQLYVYHVYSMVGGQGYHNDGSTAMAMPMEAPESIGSLSWYTAANENNEILLWIEINWTPVDGAIGYEVFAQVGGGSESIEWAQTTDSDARIGFPLPPVDTCYRFKVRAFMTVYTPESDETQCFTGPFSREAVICVPAQIMPQETPANHLVTVTPAHGELPTPTPSQWRTRQPPQLTPTPTWHILTMRPLLPTHTPTPGPIHSFPTPFLSDPGPIKIV